MRRLPVPNIYGNLFSVAQKVVVITGAGHWHDPHEATDFATKPFLGGHSKVLKRDEIIIAASVGEHKGCNDAQANLLNGRNRNCSCSAISLVPRRHPAAGDASVVDQPHR